MSFTVNRNIVSFLHLHDRGPALMILGGGTDAFSIPQCLLRPITTIADPKLLVLGRIFLYPLAISKRRL